MSLVKQLLICTITLALILALEYYTKIDLGLQNYFYNFETKEWLINPLLHKQLSIIFYSGIKNLVIAIGVVSLIITIASFFKTNLKRYRHFAMLLCLGIIFVPTIVAGSKHISNVYCPVQLEMYGGKYPFVRVVENYPNDFVQAKKGKCFPAGHSTVGFSLMILFFCFKNKRRRIVALTTAISLGWITGTYQMLRGQHFLFHTLFSMVASWMVVIVINSIVTRLEKCSKDLEKS